MVCSLEVVEHVTDVKAFVQTLTPLVKPGGLLFMSTINRNPVAAALTVGMAEYVLGLLPPGTFFKLFLLGWQMRDSSLVLTLLHP